METVFSLEFVAIAFLVATGWISALLALYGVWTSKSFAGVSLASTSLTLCLSGLWVAYGLVEHSMAQVVANTPVFVTTAMILYLVRTANARRALVLALLPMMLVFGATLASQIFDHAVISVLLGFVTAVVRIPQLISVIRGISFDGLSLSSSAIAALSAAGWSTYGMTEEQMTVVVCSLWGTLTWGVIAWRVWQNAHRKQTTSTPAVQSELRSDPSPSPAAA